MFIPRSRADGLSALVDAIGTDAFAPRLMTLLHELCGADHCAVFEFGQDFLREVVAESFDKTHETREYVSRYLDQQYWRRDPAIAEVQTHLQQRPLLILRVDISRLDTELRSAIFPHVSDRILVCGRTHGATVAVSIIRGTPHALFPDDAILRLDNVAELLVSVVAKHADVIFHRPNLALALTSLVAVEQCITTKAMLPRRETEVCARILYGLSSIGVALDLGISQESVKTYRKRAYERLRIGSERELLKWYLALWGSFERDEHHKGRPTRGCANQAAPVAPPVIGASASRRSRFNTLP